MSKIFHVAAAVLAIGLMSADAQAKKVKCTASNVYGQSQTCKAKSDSAKKDNNKSTAKPAESKPAQEQKGNTGRET